MYKRDIKLYDTLYWNTTGAYNSNISLKCKVIDIGKIWIWVHVKGCLAYNNLLAENLSKELVTGCLAYNNLLAENLSKELVILNGMNLQQ